ncbi:MAG: lysophospholipid acyltransferase family protein [Endomicrobium sp.]|jgi:predicted LPLAT superfamily acyltransferase|nr:lysophospholipid acyltransferase family protein [Endomicrobium sp.]
MSQNWTGKSLGSAFFQNLLGFFIKYGGRYMAYFILYFVVIFYTLLPSVRNKASFYLKRRFPEAGSLKLLIHTYKLNLTFGKILTDRAILGIRGESEVISSEADKRLCRDLLAKGKGLIILTAHCGCWQAAMSSFDFLPEEKYVIYRRSRHDVDKHAHELSGKDSPVKFIDPAGFAGGSIEIFAALQKKAIVCQMGDRTFGDKAHSAEADFLGGKIGVPFGIYRIAAETQTPIAIIFFPYKGKGRIDSVISDVFYAQNRGGRTPADYLKEAEKFVQSLQKFTLEYPYQFFNYYDMWK